MLAFLSVSRNGHVFVGHTQLALRSWFFFFHDDDCFWVLFWTHGAPFRGATHTLSSRDGFSFSLSRLILGRKTGKYGREAWTSFDEDNTQKKHRNTTHARRHAATHKKKREEKKEGDMSLDLCFVWRRRKPIRRRPFLGKAIYFASRILFFFVASTRLFNK